MKKAHELSVICGMKISIICTDFNRTCFCYSNDKRLDWDLKKLFKDVQRPMWLTQFSDSDVKFYFHSCFFFHTIRGEFLNQKLVILDEMENLIYRGRIYFFSKTFNFLLESFFKF